MSLPSSPRPARLSRLTGICMALALVAGAYADKDDKAANNAGVAPQAVDTANQVARANPSPAKVIGDALRSRLASPRADGRGSPMSPVYGGCTNACGTGDVAEGEPCLVDGDNDTTNGGCNGDPVVFGTGACSLTICGTSSTYVLDGADQRDTDWYLLDAATLADADADGNGVVLLRTTVTSQFPAVTFIVAIGDPTCDAVSVVGQTGFGGPDCATGDPAEYVVILADHPNGIVAYVAPGNPDGSGIFTGVECAPGANDYILLIECIELPTVCAPGSGPCNEPNGTPGCEDPECCDEVCQIDNFCCIVEWDQNCVDIAIGIGCAPLPCPVSSCENGVCTLTHSQDLFTDAGNQVACADPDGNTTPNFWARCYNLVEEGVPPGENLTINSVTFGVQQATINGINVDVNLYLDCNGCPPDKPLLDAILLATQSIVVNTADEGTMITVNFPGGPVVPAGTDLIVEIGNPDDGTQEPVFAFRAMSNDGGQCAPSYIRTDGSCGLGDWTDLADIGDPPFVDTHLLQSVSATVGGVVTVECLKACGKGTGPCDEPNGSPGCEDPACCAAVCELDNFCCIIKWDQACVDIAIGIGCVPEPCFPPKGVEGVPVPSSEDFDSYPNGMLLVGVNGWGGWDDNAGVIATVTDVQFRSAPHSVLIDNNPSDDDAVQQYVGAYCEGQWTYTIWQYVPGNMVGTSYFILLNTYEDGGDKNWSTQVQFTATTGIVSADFDGEELPLITDEWVEIRVEIDLDADVQEFFYGGNLLYSDSWTERVSGDGGLFIRALDLYANTSTPVYYDDVSLVASGAPPCPWDLSGDGIVGAADLLVLLTQWGGPGSADFDGDGNVGAEDLLVMLVNWGPCPK